MEKREFIFLGLIFAALGAVILMQRSPVTQVIAAQADAVPPVVDNIGVSLTPGNASLIQGPSYLVYNTPYAFGPPVAPFLPSITAGQVGQTVNVPTDFDYSDSYNSFA